MRYPGFNNIAGNTLLVTYAIDTSSKPPTHWHCVLCSEDYVGNKHCINCHSGIYSSERTPG
ncbi:zinc-ribbon domain-containing protein [Enterobacter sp. DNRA5]|uniref:zinc-ribbon domain-containing protein n=2 Tax=Enterobacter TaxID=547 RepID=UPI001F07A26C|nr:MULTISPECIES: zinc-ribbon domain-containing protein [Enterobacter]